MIGTMVAMGSKVTSKMVVSSSSVVAVLLVVIRSLVWELNVSADINLPFGRYPDAIRF